ncbi:MAG: hypothetical protein KKC55_10865 [Gammaproteobacteria bacterium]|nr:hypothetical protein [Gammaproteobacteria bacterium]
MLGWWGSLRDRAPLGGTPCRHPEAQQRGAALIGIKALARVCDESAP